MPFAAARGLSPRKIVKTRACVSIDHAIGRRLLAQVMQHAREHGVLEDVGEVAGVKSVGVVHALLCHQSRLPRRPKWLRGLTVGNRSAGCGARSGSSSFAGDAGGKAEVCGVTRQRAIARSSSRTATKVAAAKPVTCKAGGRSRCCGASTSRKTI